MLFGFATFCYYWILQPDAHLFGLETAIFDISTQFPQWGIYIYPIWYWKSKIRKNRIHQTKLQVWPIYGSTVTFMPFKLKLMAFPIKLTPNDPNQREKIIKFWNFVFWTLGLAFKTFFGLFLFFWGLWCLRSPVACKNHICE